MKPVVAITVGDYNGIGPEVALKAALNKSVRALCNPILVGPWSVFRYYLRRLKRQPSGLKLLEPPGKNRVTVSPGKLSASAGRAAADALVQSVRLAQQGLVAAIVTAPVSKKALHLAGVEFSGQTELLQHLTHSPRVAMMLVSDNMRVGLVTIHVPLADVAGALTRTLVREKIMTIHGALVTDWNLKRPRLAVLALNPHAGEGKDIGSEEHTIIKPVVKQLRGQRINVRGPFPADSFFGIYTRGDYDAIVAMYHDQGLIPLKMSSFGKAANVTVGLPIVRTSPDHGTAFDIAGKGIADPSSMIEAVKLSVLLARNRKRWSRVAR